MIRKLRRSFIRIALLSLTVAMVMLAVVINVANWFSVRSELQETLSFLAEASAHPQNFGVFKENNLMRFDRIRNAVNEAQYFAVYQDKGGRLTLMDRSRVVDGTEDELLSLALEALEAGEKEGMTGGYLYTIREDMREGRMLIMLNIGSRISAVKALAVVSLIACFAGVLLAWLIVALSSRRAIEPLIRADEQQKQFITDAGHELKTPLTVISANMDILSLDLGENEWVQGTQKQVANMRKLVNELVYLSRMDEESRPNERLEFDLSAAAEDISAPFAAMADFCGKALQTDIQPSLRYAGDEQALRRLISVLLDNAVHYAPEGDSIGFAIKRVGKAVAIEVKNHLQSPMAEETRKHLFDRFYRADDSRAKDDGHNGFGIGLAIARAVAEKHGGSIDAYLLKENEICFRCVLG